MEATRANPSPWSKAPSALIRRLFLDRQATFWMNQLAPLYAGSECRAAAGACPFSTQFSSAVNMSN